MNTEEKMKELPLKFKKKNSQAIDFILLKTTKDTVYIEW